MSKFVVIALAGISLGMSCGALADDAPPTPQEVVGYAQSLAQSATSGDKHAMATLRSNAGMKDAGAEFGLGEYYVLTKDYTQSIPWFQQAADQSCSCGYYALGVAYDLGQGVPQDYAKAMALYLKAADELPEAKMRIGLLYAHGHGVKQDYAQAANWYRKAADAGSSEADIALGDAYQAGVGVEQDDTAAMHRYQIAADAGDAEAQYKLGLLYEHSKSIQDYKQSAAWYQKASQQGVAYAQLNLGLLYASGKGVPVDPGKALQQFQMAANQGDGQAQYHLAESFADGKGTPVDPFRAYEWMTLAEASLDAIDPTSSVVAGRLKDLEGKLSPAQLARARQAAADWLKSHGQVER